MTDTHPIVLQILPSMNQGGVERVTFDMAHALAKAFPNQKNYVASNGGSLVADLPKKTEHYQLNLNSKNPFIILKNAFMLKSFINKKGINIVHARSRAPAWSAWLAAKMAGVKFITTYHAAYKSKSLLKKLYNSIMVRGEVVITISKFIDEHVKKEYPKANRKLIVEGIDTDYFSPKAQFEKIIKEELFGNNNPVIFIPSRQSKTKGIEVAIEALKELLQSGKKLNLLLIETGKSSYIEYVKTIVEKHNLKSTIKWIAPQLDLRPYYDMCDMVLVPSIVPEALGRVNVEALAMEKSLISTNIGANPESCVHEKTGFLSEPGNPNDLAAKINLVLKAEREFLQEMQKTGREHVMRDFNINHTMTKTIDLYNSLI